MAKRLLLLNGVAIVCVILFHAAGYGFTAMFAWAHRYRDVSSLDYDATGTASYYALRLVEQVVVFAIPAFLFVSGYFISVLAGRDRRVGNLRALGARVKALAIPYLIWASIALTGLALEGRVHSASQGVWLLATGAVNPTYYFVPLLVQMYLLAPLIVLLANWNWKVLLTATALLQVCVYVGQYGLILSPDVLGFSLPAVLVPKWFFPSHVFWVAFGTVVGFQQKALKPVLERWRLVLLCCTAGLFLLGVLEWELLLRWSNKPWIDMWPTLVDGLYSIAAILTFLSFLDVEIPFAGSLVTLGVKSYGIYLVHGLALQYFSRGLYHVAPWILARQSLLQPLLIGVGLGVPLLLMSLVGRWGSPGLYKHLFG